jgi:polyisoprenoid-binding protein YceI
MENPIMAWSRKLLTALVSCVLLILAALPTRSMPQAVESQAVAGQMALTLDPARSKIHWTLGTSLHTVHGTFSFKGGTLQFDPAGNKVSGEILALATSGDSGNDGRDKKMHKDVLQSAQYPDVIFRPDRVEGKVATSVASTVQVYGTFVLLGKEHELSVPVEVNLAGDHWTGDARITIPFIDWGLKNPSNFLLKVDHSVELQLEMKGTLQKTGTP